MKSDEEALKIPLQVGTELRIKNNGEISVDNPELELAAETTVADAVLSYRFDAKTGEHILRLLDPVANHKHLRVHRIWKPANFLRMLVSKESYNSISLGRFGRRS
jgi:hypothetical protein